jgi:hypothetical protein
MPPDVLLTGDVGRDRDEAGAMKGFVALNGVVVDDFELDFARERLTGEEASETPFMAAVNDGVKGVLVSERER